MRGNWPMSRPSGTAGLMGHLLQTTLLARPHPHLPKPPQAPLLHSPVLAIDFENCLCFIPSSDGGILHIIYPPGSQWSSSKIISDNLHTVSVASCISKPQLSSNENRTKKENSDSSNRHIGIPVILAAGALGLLDQARRSNNLSLRLQRQLDRHS